MQLRYFTNLIRRLSPGEQRELLHVVRSIPESVASEGERVLLAELREYLADKEKPPCE